MTARVYRNGSDIVKFFSSKSVLAWMRTMEGWGQKKKNRGKGLVRWWDTSQLGTKGTGKEKVNAS